MPTESATDELGKEREIYYTDISNSEKVLDYKGNNLKTFDLNYENPITLFGHLYSNESSIDVIISSMILELEEKIVKNPPSPWLDKAVSAHANTSEVIDFIKSVLHNPPDITDCFYNSVVRFNVTHAFILGEKCMLIFYGDSNNNLSLSASKTIVAHELYHGITSLKVGFNNRGELILSRGHQTSLTTQWLGLTHGDLSS